MVEMDNCYLAKGRNNDWVDMLAKTQTFLWIVPMKIYDTSNLSIYKWDPVTLWDGPRTINSWNRNKEP